MTPDAAVPVQEPADLGPHDGGRIDPDTAELLQ